MGEIIRQTINLYNTVGLVDKEKNIYFVPHKADLYQKVTASRTKVCDCYYELFNQVSPFSSKYQNLDIDQWNPEDRELVIDGLIDDFRQSRGQGLALNYLIVTRAIYEVEGETETLVSNYYQAFFIDSVEQTGSRSVLLKLSRDYFTNFFYLNNNDTCTVNYDPFNPVMKNCFVERQHYDRFKYKNVGGSLKLRYINSNLKKILASEESFKYKYQYKDKRYFLPITTDFNDKDYETFIAQVKAINSKTAFRNFCELIRNNETKLKWFCELFVSYLNIIFKENILLVNSYRITTDNVKNYFKAGYCSYKGVSVPFVHTAIPFITIPKGFENIDRTWFSFGINLVYNNFYDTATRVHTIYGEDVYNTDRILGYLQDIGGSQYVLTTYVSKYSSLCKNIYYLTLENETYNQSVCIDYRVMLRATDKMTILDSTAFVKEANKTVPLKHNSFSFLPFYDKVGNYFKKKYFINISAGEYEYNVEQQVMATTTLFLVGGDNIVNFNTQHTLYYYQQDTQNPDNTSYYQINKDDLFSRFVFVIGETELGEENLVVSDRDIALDIFYDPLIESDPYCFYSISINETEQIISKLKLVESYNDTNNNFTMIINPILSYNDSYKIGLIPSYYFNEKWNRYYSETIVSIISSQVPIIEDSWISFYTTNKAQMKNQYAVQYTDYAMSIPQGMINTFGKMGSGVAKTGSGVGAISGLIEGVTGMINEGISNWSQIQKIEMSQRAKMSDMGAKPDTVKFAGSDILYDMIQNERGYYLNYYRIDEVSYNSACKYLERFGYLVNLFDSIHAFDRVGLNYVKITSFDFVEDNFVLSEEQMSAVSEIFANGVTLLHNKDYLHNLGEIINNVNYHNYELLLRT